MSRSTSRIVLIAMGAMGWVLACVFGVLACLLAFEARGRDVPWQILIAMVLGPMLASVPVGITLLAAYRGFGRHLPAKSVPQTKPVWDDKSGDGVSWRWIAFAILCGVEAMVFPLTLLAAVADDDTLMLSLPLNMSLVMVILLVGCLPYRRRASIALCTIHLIGISIATMAAAIEIQSVIVTGWFLMATAIALPMVGTRSGAARVVFGLSTAAFIVTAFLVIALNNVGQRAAEAPLFAAIVVYQVVFAPLGLLVLYREFSDRELPLRAQFGLKHLLAAMVVVCIASAMASPAYFTDDGVRAGVAALLGVLMLGGIAGAIGAAGWTKWSGDTLHLQKAKPA